MDRYISRPARCAWLVLALLVATTAAANGQQPRSQTAKDQILDLSLLVADDYPCTWASNSWTLFEMTPYRRIGKLSGYNSEILLIDGNTGTQLDVPPHSIPLPDSKLPNAGRFGTMFTDKVPAWQFGGEACVIDSRELCDSGPKGRSDLIKKERVMAWEKKHRPLGPGDVVLFYSGYTDRYYKPFPEGRRFLAEPLEGKAPGWPDPDPDCMEYLATRKVTTLGCDSPSMGPIPDLAEPTHIAGLKHGMIWTEGAVGLGQLPVTGAFYCMIGPKHANDPYSEGRAFAVVGPLAKQLIESCKKKNAVDLSVTMASDLPVWWPGAGAGNHRQRYLTSHFLYAPNIGNTHRLHVLDSHTGTHLVPPSFALPAKDFDNAQYDPEVRKWLAEYEAKYGPRGTSDETTDKVPVAQTCGPARVIDVRALVGTTDKKAWPASPEITVAEIQKYEKVRGDLRAGEIVIFHSGHSDKYFKPFPEGDACTSDPLNGKSEGWPAPGPEAILYLADKGIRCVATDGSTLGGADPKRALWTYWTLGNKGMVGVEFLTNVDKLPEKAYFLFAAVKIRGCHGGPGRAIALW
jgi:kynurenine formamidase